MFLLFYCGEIMFYDIHLEFISWRQWSKNRIATNLKYSSGFVQDTLLLCVCLPTSLGIDGDVLTFEAISTASANHCPWYFPISSLI